MDKKWYLSTSLQGSIITLAGIILGWIKFDGVTTEDMTTIVSAVFSLIGVIYSIIGRLKTKGEKITL